VAAQPQRVGAAEVPDEPLPFIQIRLSAP
jgi:hypothetical protein